MADNCDCDHPEIDEGVCLRCLRAQAGAWPETLAAIWAWIMGADE